MLHEEPLESESRRAEITASFWRAAIPVVATYASAAMGVAWFGRSDLGAKFSQLVSPLIGVPVVLLFTFTHAVLPVFFYRRFFNALDLIGVAADANSAKRMANAMRGFAGLHMAVWFGIPIVALAFFTGWLSLAWAAVHLALASRGNRSWVFVEYGSTSMALLLFVVFFSGERLFPWGLGVVAMQALLLTILDWKAREQWITQSDTRGAS